MSQTHIFNFFPGSIHSGRILKTLSLFASREKNSYLPTNQVWLNKLYFQISNSKEKMCLTIDTRDINEFGPGKFRTNADNTVEQNCYFNRNNTDSRFKCYVGKRDQRNPDKLVFLISENYFDINKSSDVLSTRPQLDGTSNGTGKSIDKENNGRSETEQRERNGPMDSAESAAFRKQLF